MGCLYFALRLDAKGGACRNGHRLCRWWSDIAIIGLNYGFTSRAGGEVEFAMAALGRTHAFIAGWALTLGDSCVVALNASADGLHLTGRICDLFAVLHPVRVVEHKGRGGFRVSANSLQLCSRSWRWWSSLLLPCGPTWGLSPSRSRRAGSLSPKKALGLLMWGVVAATLIYLAMMLATSIAVGTRHDFYEKEAWLLAAAISEVMELAGPGASSLWGSWCCSLSRARLAY